MGGPIMVAPVEFDGVRYEALHWGKQRDLGQNGGFVVAVDSSTGEELWIQRIYEITYGEKSPQKYDRFITELKLIDRGDALEVVDETGARHRLDLGTREVSLIEAAPSQERGPHPDRPPKVK